MRIMKDMDSFPPLPLRKLPTQGADMLLPIASPKPLNTHLAFVAMVLGLIPLATPAFASAGAELPTDLAGVQWVGRFGLGMAPWQEIQLKSGQRPNTFKLIQWEGVQAVEVISKASISLLARPISVDLNTAPVLCWRWRIGASLSQADMTRKEGDDYAGRVYVSFRLPPSAMGFGMRAQLALARAMWGEDVPDAAINYVWDNRQPIGTTRPNAFTDRAQMVVLRSGDQDAGRWVWERVDVRSDATRLFGAGAEPVQLAITADTDNTQAATRSGFADFHFVPADISCDRHQR